MDKKILGIIPIVAVLCFSVFLATGDNQATAAPDPQNSTVSQTVTVNIPDVIAIEAPAVTVTAAANVDEKTLSIGGLIINKSNKHIDVYVKDPNAGTIPGAIENLDSFSYTPEVGPSDEFDGTYQLFANNWKVPQGTGASGTSLPEGLSVHIPSYTDGGSYTTVVTVTGGRHTYDPVT